MRAVEFSEIVCPVPTWDGSLWYAGHFYSGREPSSAVYDPAANNRAHVGVDLDANFLAHIVSPYPGVGAYTGYNSGAGNWIAIEHLHATGRTFYSRHLHIIDGGTLIEVGQPVAAGELVAQVGSTGGSSGPHDHFELLWDKVYAYFTEDKHIDVEKVLTGYAGRGKEGLNMIADIQESLNALGYDAGPVDGIYGSRTGDAYRLYMEDSLQGGVPGPPGPPGEGGRVDHQHKRRGNIFARNTDKVSRWFGEA